MILETAVHLGEDYAENVRSITNRLITDQTEIIVPTTDDKLQSVRAVQFATSELVSFLSQCYVWQASLTKTGLNGSWKHATLKIWIGSAER